ncbi:hypothetical protein TIFTF001_030575 [Ficus carica]|uniref:Uncharacterized protein n=1 Tax=Ficus carica TaxID=3494 RepID=A0AA88DTX1_FICCA|nr:hypothetical protein TIFTF001_030575 [Ficus carica]
MGDQQQLLPRQPDVIQQNPLEAPPEYSTEPPDFSVLRLEADEHRQLQSPCANCGFAGVSNGNGSGSGNNSLKRSSPSSVNSQQPKPKKLFLDEPANYPFLRRCVSDTYHLPSVHSPPESVPGISSNTSPTPKITPNVTDSSTPCSAKASASANDGPALPPLPPKLRRSISAPSPSPAKSPSRTSSSNDLDNSKKLTKIWDWWKEMNTWMEEFMRVEESDQDQEDQTESLVEQQQQQEVEEELAENGQVTEVNNTANGIINNATEDCEKEFEESLSVERDGKCLNVQFKCHCGKRYHFLLADGSCFYKLM